MINMLIIDPNILFRQSLKKLIVQNIPHIDVEVAKNGREGLVKLDAVRPQVVLLEIHLPGNNGLEYAKQMKSKHPEVIIVLLTSYITPEYEQAAKDFGIEHLIPKDEWTGDDIITLVQSIVSDLK